MHVGMRFCVYLVAMDPTLVNTNLKLPTTSMNGSVPIAGPMNCTCSIQRQVSLCYMFKSGYEYERRTGVDKNSCHMNCISQTWT